MKKADLVHLHVHSQYSLLDGLESCESLFERLKEVGMDTLSLTDHGTMRGLIDFYFTAKENDITPILGQEFYFIEDAKSNDGNHKDNHIELLYNSSSKRPEKYSVHSTILIKNNIGWKNCIKMTTAANKPERYYYNPRIDLGLLGDYSEGLKMGSGCFGSMTSSLWRQGLEKESLEWFDRWLEIFGSDFFIELTTTEDEIQRKLNKWLLTVAKEKGIPFIVSSDVHYANKQSYEDHNFLMTMKYGKEWNPEEKVSPTEETWLKSENEMWDYWNKYCQGEYEISEEDFYSAMCNTKSISDECKQVDLSQLYSDYRMPDMGIVNPKDTLLDKCLKRSIRNKVLQNKTSEEKEVYIKRLAREIDLIVDQGFASYFIMTADLTDYLRDNDIMKGLARGSAGGSLLAWWLGITDIDPMVHNLSFERFMNAQKKSMPDIDIDIDDEKRPEIMKYFISKYGENNVAQIGTYIKLQEKSSLKDVARALKIPFDKSNAITKEIGRTYSSMFDKDDREKMKQDVNLRDNFLWLSKNYPEWIRLAHRFAGKPKAKGKHPAGIVVGDEPLDGLVPLQKAKDTMVTEWIDGTVRKELTEDLKLVKFDLLGLSTLNIIQKVFSLIREKHSSNPSFDKLDLSLSDTELLSSIPIGDDKVFELFPNNLLGIFQFDTDAVQSILKVITPSNLKELCALNSLNRPATKDMVDEYVKGRNKKRMKYDHPVLEEVLGETYGIMLYQEQVMELAHKLGGVSLEETDSFRKALVKITGSNVESQKKLREETVEKFIKGSIKNGLDKNLAIKWGEKMVKFAGYGFNKSHSRAYSLLSYYTLYLKYYFREEFYTAFLNKRPERLNDLFREAMHYIFLPVDVNKSKEEFVIEGDRIRIGFKAVKGLGESAINEIVSNQPFSSVEDLQKRTHKSKLNRSRIKALENSGALFDFGLQSSFLKERQHLGINVRYSMVRDIMNIKNTINLDSMFDDNIFRTFIDINDLVELSSVSRKNENICCVIGCVIEVEKRSYTPRNSQDKQLKTLLSGEIFDETGSCQFICWDWEGTDKKGNNYSPPINFKAGDIIVIYGRKGVYGGKQQIKIPSIKEIEGTNYNNFNWSNSNKSQKITKNFWQKKGLTEPPMVSLMSLLAV